MPRKKKTESLLEKKPREEDGEKKEESSLGKTSEKETIKEFPDLDIAIDVFASPSAEKDSISDKEEKIKEIRESSFLERKTSEKEKKLEEIREKAKKFAEKIEGEEKIVEELKKAKRSEKTLFPLDDYVKYSAHLGTKAITPNMRQYVYKRRADGLAVLNTNSIDEKLKEACEFLARFNPEDIFLACKREVGWPAAKKFSEVTGIRVFTKKYPAGIITNTNLNDFFETELVIVCDPWLDKNALNDAIIIRKPVIALCDTNNLTTGTTKIIPCNNKAGKSLGLILYLMAREYLKIRGKDEEAKKLKLEDFAGKIEENLTAREPKEDREGRIIEEKSSFLEPSLKKKIREESGETLERKEGKIIGEKVGEAVKEGV